MERENKYYVGIKTRNIFGDEYESSSAEYMECDGELDYLVAKFESFLKSIGYEGVTLMYDVPYTIEVVDEQEVLH